MQPFFGDDPEEPAEEPDREDDICNDCGARMEWTLDLDGVQRLECPDCDD